MVVVGIVVDVGLCVKAGGSDQPWLGVGFVKLKKWQQYCPYQGAPLVPGVEGGTPRGCLDSIHCLDNWCLDS